MALAFSSVVSMVPVLRVAGKVAGDGVLAEAIVQRGQGAICQGPADGGDFSDDVERAVEQAQPFLLRGEVRQLAGVHVDRGAAVGKVVQPGDRPRQVAAEWLKLKTGVGDNLGWVHVVFL